MNHASLCTGIGGFDLAAQQAGYNNVFQCEIDKFCQRVLRYHFPQTTLYDDIRTTDFTKYRGTIDALSAGWPCQPFSIAGKRLGTKDDRFLWPQVFRVVIETSPMFFIGENVLGLLTQQSGVVFKQVLSDLENADYTVLKPLVIPACGVNAPHKRDRVWLIAVKNSFSNGRFQREPGQTGAEVWEQWYLSAGGAEWFCVQEGITSDCADTGFEDLQSERQDGIFGQQVSSDTKCNGRRAWRDDSRSEAENECQEWDTPAGLSQERTVADPNIGYVEGRRYGKERCPNGQTEESGVISGYRASISTCSQEFTTNSDSRRMESTEDNRQPSFYPKGLTDFSSFPTQPPICGRNDGLSERLVGISFPKWRNESIKALGNSIVPQIAYQLFMAIKHCYEVQNA